MQSCACHFAGKCTYWSFKTYGAELAACEKNISLLFRPQSSVSPSGTMALISHLKKAKIELILSNPVESGMVQILPGEHSKHPFRYSDLKMRI